MSRRRVALAALVAGLVAGTAFGLFFAESPTTASDCSLDRDDVSVAWHLERYGTGCSANGDRFSPERRSELDRERESDFDTGDAERNTAQTATL